MNGSSPPSRRQAASASRAQEFEMLYVESFRGVYGYIAARVQDVPTAEDLTSETFLRAWQKWPPRTTAGLVPKAWLFTIARNLVIDHYRAAGRHPAASLDEAQASNREIGAILNLSEAAAGMACLRALRRLEERLGEA